MDLSAAVDCDRLRVPELDLRPDLDVAGGQGSIRCTTLVDFGGRPSSGWSVRTTVTDPRGRRVARPLVGGVPHRFAEAIRAHVPFGRFRAYG